MRRTAITPCAVRRAIPAMLVVALLGCSPSSPSGDGGALALAVSGPPEARPLSRPMASDPLDLDAVMRRVQRSFRRHGDALEGSLGGYAVTVAEGRFDLRAAARSSQPATFETLSLGRSRHVVRGFSTQSRAEDGAAHIRRGPYLEALELTPAGVEQSWQIPSLPPGTGDFVVRLAVGGQTYAGVTGGGVHFVDETSGLGTRYGHATWIDSSGKRTPIAARFVDGVLELRVEGDVVDRSTYPVLLDPVIGPEVGMNVPLHWPQGIVRSSPQAASNGAGMSLLVWWAADEIYGARVAADGTLLDTLNIPIASAPGMQWSPAVAWDGTSFFVVWSDGRNGQAVYGARVSPQGVVLDPQGIFIASGADEPAVAWNGSVHLVALRPRTAGRVRAVRVTAGGVVQDPDPVVIGADGSFGRHQVVTDGDGFFVVFDSDLGESAIYGARVSAAGVVEGITTITAEDALSRPSWAAASWNGTSYFVVWLAYHFETPSRLAHTEVHGARVSATGTVQDVDGVQISDNFLTEAAPTVSWDGDKHLVMWSYDPGLLNDTRRIAGTLVSSAGVVGEPLPGPSNILQTDVDPVLVWDGTTHLMAWNRGGTVWAAGMTAEAAVNEGPVSRPMAPQTSPSVSWDGTSYLVVWQEEKFNYIHPLDVYGVLVSADGTVQDPSGIPIAADPSRDEETPRVSWDGTNHFVVWEDSDEIYGARVSPQGEVLDPGGIPIAVGLKHPVTPPEVASNGAGSLVVWHDFSTAEALTDIRGARVSSSGEVLDPNGFLISGVPGHQQNPTASCKWHKSNAKWRDRRLIPERIYGARVSASGVVEDGSEGPIVPAGPEGQFLPAVGWNGSEHLVVWWQTLDGPVGITGALVGGAGDVLSSDDVGVLQAPGNFFAARRPDVSTIGSDFLVVWSASSDVLAARLGAAGDVLEGGPFAVAPIHPITDQPCVVGGAVGEALIAYTRAIPENRIVARVVCVPSSSDDVTCDGVDDDCDGEVDDDHVALESTCGAGSCAATGTVSCVDGALVDSCTVQPIAEDDVTCDGVDDDCDGAVDEDYLGQETTCGVGACAATGTTICVEGGVVDPCVPRTEPEGGCEPSGVGGGGGGEPGAAGPPGGEGAGGCGCTLVRPRRDFELGLSCLGLLALLLARRRRPEKSRGCGCPRHAS